MRKPIYRFPPVINFAMTPVIQRDLGRGRKKKVRLMKKMRGTISEPETYFLKCGEGDGFISV